MKDEDRLHETISYKRCLACIPRWILKTRTTFAAFLARTFHIRRSGTCPASTVFPIPAPELGLFDSQVGPRLSARRWSRLCIKRALHVVVMALNYIHSGMTFVLITQLGRRPSPVHLAICDRLRPLLTVCDRPEQFPITPGRSGAEFIARLVELEHFAGSHEAFCPDLYAGSTCTLWSH